MNDFESKLPVYQAARSKDFPDYLIVRCPREDCGSNRPFLVATKDWLRPRRTTNKNSGKVTIIVGRSCPYCMKASRIPARREIG